MLSFHQVAEEQDIRGNVVLITGGSKGLGLALAREFARQGCRLAICARDVERLPVLRGDVVAVLLGRQPGVAIGRDDEVAGHAFSSWHRTEHR